MPNRIIKESLCTSDRIASLTDFEFRLWVGLITQADDAGRGDARPAILKGSVFPLRGRATAKDIQDALHGLAAKGCVSLYTVDGKPYFWFPTWKDHQRIRDCRPKYPAPPQEPAAGCGGPRQEAALIQSESESESQSNPKGGRSPLSQREEEPGKQNSCQKLGGFCPPDQKLGGFCPPQLEEVAAYCRERNNRVDPQKWMDHYSSNGWMVGQNRMRDWRASVRSWERNRLEDGRGSPKREARAPSFDLDAFERDSLLPPRLRQGGGLEQER